MNRLRDLLAPALAVLAWLAWPSPSFSGEVAHLTLNSTPGSFIGAGQDWDITYTPQNSQNFFTEIVEDLYENPE